MDSGSGEETFRASKKEKLRDDHWNGIPQRENFFCRRKMTFGSCLVRVIYVNPGEFKVIESTVCVF